MATVTDTATGRSFDAAGAELDYYRGEASVDPGRYVIVEDPAVEAARFPVVHDETGAVVAAGGEQVEQLPAGESLELSGEQTSPGTGEPNIGYTVPEGATGATLGPDGATAEVDGQTVVLQPDSNPPADESGQAGGQPES